MEIDKASIDGNFKEVFIQCALMPNGEAIHLGKTIMRLHAPEDESLEYVYERRDEKRTTVIEHYDGSGKPDKVAFLAGMVVDGDRFISVDNISIDIESFPDAVYQRTNDRSDYVEWSVQGEPES